MDNYAEFLQRLDSAARSLKKRQARLRAVEDVLSTMYQHNQYGLDQWAKRMARVENIFAVGKAQDRASLADLKAISSNMVSVFRPRTELVGQRLAAVQSRLNEVSRSLHTLELNKQRLVSSRRIAEERQNLSRAVLGLAGTAEGASAPVPDIGLREELKAATEAVLLAEALLELKGD